MSPQATYGYGSRISEWYYALDFGQTMGLLQIVAGLTLIFPIWLTWLSEKVVLNEVYHSGISNGWESPILMFSLPVLLSGIVLLVMGIGNLVGLWLEHIKTRVILVSAVPIVASVFFLIWARRFTDVSAFQVGPFISIYLGIAIIDGLICAYIADNRNRRPFWFALLGAAAVWLCGVLGPLGILATYLIVRREAPTRTGQQQPYPQSVAEQVSSVQHSQAARTNASRSCAGCGAARLPDHTFCPVCGRQVPVPAPTPVQQTAYKTCSGCGNGVDPALSFCNYCGAALR